MFECVTESLKKNKKIQPQNKVGPLSIKLNDKRQGEGGTLASVDFNITISSSGLQGFTN